jgi:hypothetical protein
VRPLRDIEEATECLLELGYHSRVRDWSMGHTVAIMAAPLQAGKIAAYRSAIYVFPNETGRQILDCELPSPLSDVFTTLSAAVEVAVSRLGPPVQVSEEQS